MSACRVLVVDDDDELRESLVMALEASHFEVVAARDGDDALACLDQHVVDVIVLDLNMPVLDGPGFLAAYRARGGGAPVIVVSAGLDLPRKASSLGVSHWMAKPFDLEALERTLATACGHEHVGRGRTRTATDVPANDATPPLRRGSSAG